MNRFWWRSSNPILFFLIVLLGVAIQTSLFTFFPLYMIQPNIVLLAVLWCALKRDLLEGGILTLIFSHVAEIHSGSPRGVLLLSFMFVFLSVRALNRYLVFPDRQSIFSLVFFAEAGWRLSVLAILFRLGMGDQQVGHTLLFLLPGSIIQVVFSIWLFPLFEKLDIRTFKDPRVRQALDDELHLEEEGI